MTGNSARALFSLSVGDGAGTMLGLAAGDVAGGKDALGYSYLTQQATVVGYHLMKHGQVQPPDLFAELAELGGANGDPAVYRHSSPEFSRFLEHGPDTVSSTSSAEPSIRAVPIGLWYKDDPEHLVRAAISAAAMTQGDEASILMACAVAGGVAASALGQNGPDLVLAGIETIQLGGEALDLSGFSAADSGVRESLIKRLRSTIPLVAASPNEVRSAITDEGSLHGHSQALAAFALAAPVVDEPFRLIESGALLGSSALGSLVGAMIGSRVGTVLWPWVVPNDTWFAEIGRRLVSRSRVFEDLPVPYDVEDRLTNWGEDDHRRI